MYKHTKRSVLQNLITKPSFLPCCIECRAV